MFKLLFITLTVVASSLLSFQKEADNNELLIGSWIESSNNSDTLVFSNHDNKAYFSLNRGKENRNGYLLPKYNSGLYEYMIQGDSISIRWFLSSNSNHHNHYLHFYTANQFIIGNFFEDSLSSDKNFIFNKMP